MNQAVLDRYNVHLRGAGSDWMLFAHGFGCDQNMWRYVAPAFDDDYRIALMDYIGHGESDRSAWDPARYTSLDGYVDDVLQIADALDIRDGVFVGHSVSAMIGALASQRAPHRFNRLVMIGPSARYINDDDYFGGFRREDIDELLASLESNYLGWSSAMAPVIMGRPDHPEYGQELANAFCRTDPAVARQFARTTFLGDNRADLPRTTAHTLVLQCSDDIIAPEAVGRYVHERIPNSELVVMKATGHCPNLSAPEETIAAMKAFLG